jgi:hypothetical protein
MSELAQHLLAVIERGPIAYADLWAAVETDDPAFDEMQYALAELIDAGKIEQIDATFAYRIADAA